MKIEIEVMDRIDIIKMLEEIIDSIDSVGSVHPFDYYDDIDRAITTLKHCKFAGEEEVNDPPGKKDRPNGKWKIDIGCCECSKCGWLITAGDEEIDNYCPHCGAYMREW